MVAVVDLGEEDLVGGHMNRGRERGEWEEGSRRRRRGGLIPSSTPVRGCGGNTPCSDLGRGNREGDEAGERGRVGRMGQVGRPGCELGHLVQGEGSLLFVFFLLFSLLHFLLFISLLFYFILWI